MSSHIQRESDDVGIAPVRWLTAAQPAAANRNDATSWYQRALTADAASAGKHVIRLAARNLSASERAATDALTPAPLLETDTATLASKRDDSPAPTWSVMALSGQQVVAHASIRCRVIQVGNVRVPVGGMSGVMTLPEWRGRGRARAVVDSAAAFVGIWLWAPFAVVMCPTDDARGFYAKSGWHRASAPVWYERADGERKPTNRVAMILPCQGEAEWPDGPIDLCGAAW